MQSSPIKNSTATTSAHASVIKKEMLESKKILHRTFGMWRGRQSIPIVYQQKMSINKRQKQLEQIKGMWKGREIEVKKALQKIARDRHRPLP